MASPVGRNRRKSVPGESATPDGTMMQFHP
jgi:hypothetical protein